MKKVILITGFIFYSITFNIRVESCSMFYANIGNSILGSNSEDWDNINSMIKFIPSQNGRNGRIVFGFNDWGLDFCPYGGVNDQGLFYAWANISTRDPNFHVLGTQYYNGVLDDTMEEYCTTVDDAIKWFKKYNEPGFGGAHILIGDRFGNSVVIERSNNDSLAFIKKTGNYQIATNFLNAYLNNPKMYRFIEDPRYQFIDETLRDKDSISVELFSKVLQTAGNNGDLSPTIYSNVFDLKNGKVYVYNYYNFEEVLILDINKELAKGCRFFKLPGLFSRIKAEYPVSNTLVNSSSVELKWVGDASIYKIWLATNDQFSNPTIINYSDTKIQNAGFSIFYSIILLIMIFGIKKNKNLKLIVVFCFVIIAGCEKDLTILPQTQSNVSHSSTIDNLQSNTKYYWKIVTNNSNAINTESKVESFTTSKF